MKRACNGWMRFGSCVAAGMLAFSAARALGAVPAAPTNLVSAADSQTKITLWWNDASSDETGFKIERSATGTSGWSQIGAVSANVATYANTGLVANALWYYRVCATNGSGSSGYTGVANAHTGYDQGGRYGLGTPVWKAVLLVYLQTDTDYVLGSVTNHETSALTATEITDAVSCFRDDVARAHEFSGREGLMQYDIVYITNHAVTHVTDMGSNNYWLSPSDTAADLDLYAPSGKYDSIFVHWSKGAIPSTGWGWGLQRSSWANDCTYHTVTEAAASAWSGSDVWLHEWLHGLCSYYHDEHGYPMPNGGADGGGSHGYTSDPVEGWGAYYRDLMTGRVWETNMTPAQYTGITTPAWRAGTPLGGGRQVQAEYFWTDTTSRFKKTGAVSWAGRYNGVNVGTSTAADNKLYTTLRPSGRLRLSGRVYVPSSGVGPSDSVAVAFRDPTHEWWATLEYGSSLTKQLSLMKDGVRQATYAMTLPAGGYAVAVDLDYSNNIVRMQAWPDGSSAPTNWLLSASLNAGWTATEIGFRHYGQGTRVDDLWATADVPPVFTAVNAGLPGLREAVLSWGDYDNDGNLDLALCGFTSGGLTTRIYHNNGSGTFTNIGADLPGRSAGALEWGDYDNDGDLDLLVTGWEGIGAGQTILYRNDAGTFTYSGIYLDYPLSQCTAKWGDYDNDGDVDLALAGANDSGGYTAVILRNDGGTTFTDIGAGLRGGTECDAEWGDYDNDGDLDLLLQGRDGTGRFCDIYRNDGAAGFTPISAGLPAASNGGVAWGDYDGDGWLDVAIFGNNQCTVYRNQHNGTFANSGQPLPQGDNGAVRWADWDNDGDSDLLIMGYNGDASFSAIARNNGDGTLTAYNQGLPNGLYGDAVWGDYNNDGRLDALMAGDPSDSRFCDIYRNNLPGGPTNTPPTAPSGLSAATNGLSATLNWSASSDAQTAAALLTYNLRVGTTSGGCQIVSAQSLATGRRCVPARGNAGYGLSQALTNLPPGQTIYWSVQAVDGAFAGGPFATQASFQTPATPVVTTLSLTTIDRHTATCGGNVTAIGGAPVTARGVCWKTDVGMPRSPDTSDAHTTDGSGVGVFASSLTGLAADTFYRVRAYAVNAYGTAYGAELTFTTLAMRLPAVTTASASNVLDTTAACGGNVTDEGTTAVTARGCVWNTNGVPTVGSNNGITTNGSGPGAFSSSLTGLTAGGQTYFVRAYAVNEDGTTYGAQRVIATRMTSPGNALAFDGTNDYVRIADADSLDLTGAYTLECWFKADGFGGLRGLISKYQSYGANGYSLRLNEAELDFDQLMTTGLNLQTGLWYHVAAVKSGGTRALYLNGVAQALSGSAAAVSGNSDELRLGSDYGGRFFDGQMDEARLWNVARSQDEVRDAMHLELGRTNNLVAHYTFNQTSGAALADASGNENAGGVSNGAAWVASVFPCAVVITNRHNLRATWPGQSNSLLSVRLAVSNGVVSGTNWAIFGHNGGDDSDNRTDVPTSLVWRLNRAWQLETRGNVTGKVVVATAGLFHQAGNGTGLRLLVDADGVFTNASALSGFVTNQSFVVTGQLLRTGYYYSLGGVETPALTTAPVTNIGRQTATCGGSISRAGNSPITSRGCVWSTSTEPTLADNYTVDGAGTGTFVSVLTNLPPLAYCHVRAYAVNSEGAFYGDEQTFWSRSDSGWGLRFTGDAANFDYEYIQIPDNDALDLTTNYTLEAWFRTTLLSEQPLICKGNTTTASGYRLNVYGTELHFDGMMTAGANLQTGRWYHVAAVNSNGTRSLFLNGVSLALANHESYTVNINGSPLYIGTGPGGPDYYYFGGELDEVRVWSVPRSESEIRDSMHKAVAGGTNGLAAYYTMNEGVGMNVCDQSGHNFNGVMKNMEENDWVKSTIPFADVVADRANLRGIWSAQTNSLVSDRFRMAGGTVTGLNFAVFGHDGGTNDWTTADVPNGAVRRLGRVWCSELAGAAGADLAMDASGLALSDPSFLRLLTSSNGVFANASVIAGSYMNGLFTAPGQTLAAQKYYTLGEMLNYATVTTAPIGTITATSASGGGEVALAGSGTVTARGLCWNTGGGATTNDARTTDGSGPGPFVSTMTNLVKGTLYYVRAYAVNGTGTSYGNELKFIAATPPGNALDFNNSSYASGSGLPTNFPNRMTLECWVHHDDLTNNRISRYVTVEPDLGVIRHDSGNAGRLQTYFKLNGSVRGVGIDNVLQTSRWYHVAGIWDGTNVSLYLNGLLLTNANFAGMTLATNNGGITLGHSSEYLNGRLDEVRIWSAARTQNDTRDAMHKQLAGTESGLAAYYPCNEGSGTVVHDLVSEANVSSLITVGWASSTFPCANVVANRSNIRGAWLAQTNSFASSILSVSNASAAGVNFRVFGHDNGALTGNTTDKPAAYAWRLNRAWQVEGTGAITGDLVFDCSGLGGVMSNTALLRLLADADGAFSNATAVAGTYTNTTKAFTVSAQTLSNGWFYTLTEGGWPTVTTTPISNVTHRAAQGGGNVTITGASPVTARGVCWGLAGSPTTNNSCTTDGSGGGAFASQLTGLLATQTYYVRAYAVNAHGTAYGDERTFTTVVNPPGSGLDFDGTNDYVAIPDHNQLDMTSNYTLECWFKADSFGLAGNLRGLIDKYHTSGACGYLLRLNGTELEVDEVKTSGLNLQSNRWYHAAAVNSNGIRTLYVNGVVRTISGTPYTVLANTDELRLGCDYGNRFYDGQMDEVRLWNVVRSEADIRDAMHRQLSGSEPGLVAYYNFNVTSGVTLSDLTGNGHPGTLTNGPVWTNSTLPCANLIANTNNLRGAWLTQTNSLASSLLSVSNSAVTGVGYRVFGHDGKALTNSTTDRPAAFAWRLNRAWQVEGTGSFTGTLAFDCTGITNLIQNAARLRLLVDGDGAFVNASAATGTYAASVFKVLGQTLPQNGYYTIGEYGTRTLTAMAGPHGAISPSNAIVVTYGDSTSFVVTPSTYWHVGNVTTNGASVGAVTSFTWSNVIADGTINANFAADLAAQSTPHWWLAQYGLTNGGWTFNQAETNKSDSDAFDNGQEYIADTNPTNPASYFRITAFSNSPATTVSFVSSAGRAYTLIGVSNLTSGAWSPVPGAGPRLGTGGADSLSDTNVPHKGPFYRLKVNLP